MLSNESILNELNMDITGLLVPKLIFGSSKTTQDLSCYSNNFGKKCDIRDQHILFYRFTKIINIKKTKKHFRISEGVLRHK